MIVFPNAKINLGLQITGRRADGYHLLESLFIPIPLCDILEFVPSASRHDSLKLYGDIDSGSTEDNLVLRAINALRTYAEVPPLDIFLHKMIPSGAGMGGGSADATFTLIALRQMFELDLSDDILRCIALGLGADCPFFVRNSPSLVSGIGEVFSPVSALPIADKWIVVLKPDVHISTREAFAGLGDVGGHIWSVSEIIQRPIEEWCTLLVNDFERSLFPKYPKLAYLKTWLYEQGASYASMTGSGSALYGIFDVPMDEQLLKELAGCFTWQGQLGKYR